MTTNLEKVREAIVKAVPEIMELKDGCLVKVWWLAYLADIQQGQEPDEIVQFSSRTMRGNGPVEGKYHGVIEDNVTGIVEILGRPITLDDILRATPLIVIDKAEEIWGKDVVSLYVPGKDGSESYTLGLPLDQQSEALINFLATILV